MLFWDYRDRTTISNSFDEIGRHAATGEIYADAMDGAGLVRHRHIAAVAAFLDVVGQLERDVLLLVAIAQRDVDGAGDRPGIWLGDLAADDFDRLPLTVTCWSWPAAVGPALASFLLSGGTGATSSPCCAYAWLAAAPIGARQAIGIRCA